MNFKLKDGITKEDLINTKWDQSEYTEEQKVFWQETMFELGFGWGGLKKQELRFLSELHFWCCEPELGYTANANFFAKDTDKQLYWCDIFEPVDVEEPLESSVQPLQEEITFEEYKYTKKVFKLASEALIAFESGVELFYPTATEGVYKKCPTEKSVFNCWSSNVLHIKEQLPWWETVSEDKPCYVVSSKGRILKLIGSPSALGNIKKEGGGAINRVDYKPLTKEQVQDIVSTQEKWYTQEATTIPLIPKGKWISSTSSSSGYVGWLCTKCSTWVYQDGVKECRCDRS